MRRKRIGRFALPAMLAVIVGVLLVAHTFTGSAHAQGGSGCEGDVKVEGSGAVTYIAPLDDSLTSVCIKAGRSIIPVDCGVNYNDGCYTVSWTLGSDGCCTSATIAGGGTGRDCKSISHTAASFGGGSCDECVPDPKGEVCDSGSDEDCDGLVDCDDPDCDADAACKKP